MSPFSIRLNIQDEAKRQEFRRALSDLPVEIRDETGLGPLDILISDQSIDDVTLAASGISYPDGAGPVMAWTVLAVGCDGPADAVLPFDATPREIALACSLLLEIARLRKERTHGLVEQRRVRQLALTDSLSGLANRRAWDEELARQWKRPNETRHPLVLALVDLDRFKSVNDLCGHSLGDTVVQQAAAALSESLRESDFVARLGGDEFGMLLDDCAAPASALERMRQAIQSHCGGPATGQVTASFGYATRNPADTMTSLFERADAALRVAKESGRNRVSGERVR